MLADVEMSMGPHSEMEATGATKIPTTTAPSICP